MRPRASQPVEVDRLALISLNQSKTSEKADYLPDYTSHDMSQHDEVESPGCESQPANYPEDPLNPKPY